MTDLQDLVIPPTGTSGPGYATTIDELILLLVDRAKPVFNIRDFGALGSGDPANAATNRVALNDAIAKALAAGGGKIYVPYGYGDYVVEPDTQHIGDWGPNLELFGDGMALSCLKIKDAAGHFSAFFEPADQATDCSNTYVHDIWLDQNNTGNRVLSAGDLDTGKTRSGFLTTVGSNMRWERVRFTDWHGVWCIVVDPVASHATNKNIAVEHCIFDQIGDTIAQRDHSTVYLTGDGLRVAHNKFYAKGPLASPNTVDAVCSIEMHGTNYNVEDNYTEGYNYQVNVLGVGTTPGEHIKIRNNRGYRLAGGVYLYSGAGQGDPVGGHYLNDVKICGNSWVLDRAAYKSITSYQFGVARSHQPGLTVNIYPLMDIEICHNTMVWINQAGPAVDTSEAAYSGVQWVSTEGAGCVDEDVRIHHNTVRSCPGAGFYLSADGTANFGISRLQVCDNDIHNPVASGSGAGSTVLLAGVFVGEGAFYDSTISRNRTYDYRGPHTLGAGCVSLDNIFINANNEAFDNDVRLTDATWQDVVQGATGWLLHTKRIGTPEGHVAAAVGSTCARLDGGAGTSLYVKESGSGSAGWVGK